ncbi:MAG TPA: GUN4 domain-containing protein [Crinalium sp.]|jgi:hypothetical protein
MVSYLNESEEYSGVDCTQLEKYLKAGMWKMADLETRKLVYDACGVSPNDPRNSPSISQIPAPDLLRIDGLWVKYSRGRFGFSVQQAIWQPLEKKFYNKTDAWSAFGDRVGWRINNLLKRNYWKPYKELSFEANAPMGHLPHLGDKFGIVTVEAFTQMIAWCNSQQAAEKQL